MALTVEQVKRIGQYVGAKAAETYTPMLNAAMSKYSIDTPLRQAHFLAQIMHESGSLIYTKELATGEAYEGRKDLGNTQVGDGRKFKGRGFMQLTGRANYEQYGKVIGVDLLSNPELVATKYPADVSGWFWKTRGLNELADKDDFLTITKRINGGTNGIEDRQHFLEKSKTILGA